MYLKNRINRNQDKIVLWGIKTSVMIYDIGLYDVQITTLNFCF